MTDERPPAADASAAADPARRLSRGMAHHVPHNRALGLRFVSLEGDRVTLRLPYDGKLVGNPATGVLHGGAITSLLDATCGIAVFTRLKEPRRIATLDLRIDYLKPAAPGLDVLARARCFKVTRSVAFVRCEAFHAEAGEEEEEDRLVAVANGTFMIFDDAGAGGGGG